MPLGWRRRHTGQLNSCRQALTRPFWKVDSLERVSGFKREGQTKSEVERKSCSVQKTGGFKSCRPHLWMMCSLNGVRHGNYMQIRINMQERSYQLFYPEWPLFMYLRSRIRIKVHEFWDDSRMKLGFRDICNIPRYCTQPRSDGQSELLMTICTDKVSTGISGDTEGDNTFRIPIKSATCLIPPLLILLE